MHIPKTGGITLRSYLSGLFSSSDVCFGPPKGGAWKDGDVPDGCRFYSGHFDVDFIKRRKVDSVILTVIREPTARIISMYDFWRSIRVEWADEHLSSAPLNAPRFARMHDFDGFLATQNQLVRDAISNSSARQLLGEEYEGLSHDEAKAATAAFERLLSFDWYTTTERLSQDLPELARLLGAAEPDQLHLHRTYSPTDEEPRTAVTPTIANCGQRDQIKRLNGIDTVLYELASEELEQRTAGRRRSR
jgi:hypothetical protein